MSNPFEGHHELTIEDGKDYGYSSVNPKVLVDCDGTVLFVFPREMSNEHIWSVALRLEGVWKLGFEAGQQDVHHQLRKLIGS
jgi:hypothetical protein